MGDSSKGEQDHKIYKGRDRIYKSLVPRGIAEIRSTQG